MTVKYEYIGICIAASIKPVLTEAALYSVCAMPGAGDIISLACFDKVVSSPRTDVVIAGLGMNNIIRTDSSNAVITIGSENYVSLFYRCNSDPVIAAILIAIGVCLNIVNTGMSSGCHQGRVETNTTIIVGL